MITADKLNEVTRIKKDALVSILENSSATPSWAYAIKKCKFIGITNGGQFCYMAVFQVKGGTDSTKVFLDYNHTMDRVFADYQLTELS